MEWPADDDGEARPRCWQARPGGPTDGGDRQGRSATLALGSSAARRGGWRSHRRWEIPLCMRGGREEVTGLTRGGREEVAGLTREGREEGALVRPLLEKGGYGSHILFLCTTQTGECVL